MRLLSCPALITLHAEAGGGGGPLLLDVTCRVCELEVLLPGFGFITEIANVPTEFSVPVALSCIEETKVVVSAEPLSKTCAPFTKLLPVIESVKLPMATDAGEMLLNTGTGFHSVTALPPLALESEALTASIVTLFGLGRLAGAVKTPEELIVPVAAVPPVTLLTCQATVWLDSPLTLAVNVSVPPMRTFTGFGETVTLTAGGGVPGSPGLPEEPLIAPAHRAWNKAAAITKMSEARRMAVGVSVA
ncbi:MAG: hypothetical protein WA581_04110 [Candidatus Acidiferrales bacterium]